jgi:hypothetical protein
VRIRRPTGRSASPLPGLNNNSNAQNCPHFQRISTAASGMSVADWCAGAPPPVSVVSIMVSTLVVCGGGR